jgi:hypothetical protein
VQQRPTGFRHHYLVDGNPYSVFTSIPRNPPSAGATPGLALHLGLAYLIDIASITLPHRIHIACAKLPASAITFWEETARHLGAERLVEDRLPPSALDCSWTSSGRRLERLPPSPPKARRQTALAMSGGKESLAALKLLRGPSPNLFFLQYTDSSWAHGRMVYESFRSTHHCHVVRTDIINTGKLNEAYGCGAYGVFVIGQLIFSSLLMREHFSKIEIGNEFSANFGNGDYLGVPVNHQHDKSFAFAEAVNQYLKSYVAEDFGYHSPFWGWYEYRIAKAFFADERYLDRWTSCNNATSKKWFCGTCSKCAFVFLLAVASSDLRTIVQRMRRNLLLDLELMLPLIDPGTSKPLECVGTKEEAWVALDDLWRRGIGLRTPVLRHFARHIRPAIRERLPSMRAHLLRVHDPRGRNFSFVKGSEP